MKVCHAVLPDKNTYLVCNWAEKFYRFLKTSFWRSWGLFLIAITSNKFTTGKLFPACGSFSGKAATKMHTPLCPDHFQQNLVFIKQAKLPAWKQAAREAPSHSSLPQSCSTAVTTQGKLTLTCKRLGGRDTKQCFQQLFFPCYIYIYQAVGSKRRQEDKRIQVCSVLRLKEWKRALLLPKFSNSVLAHHISKPAWSKNFKHV